MEINKVESFRRTFQLKHPSAVAYGSTETAENVIVKLTASNGKVGWGNCAPDAYVTGEKIEDTERFLTDAAPELLLHKDIGMLGVLNDELLRHGARTPAACAGLNIALYDLLGKCAHLPVYQLLGACRSSILTSVTVSLINLDDAVKLAQEYVGQGFSALKIKIGTTWQEDYERIVAIARAVGKEIELRLDANQAYEPGDALALLAKLEDQQLNIAFLEQPTRARHIYSLKEVTTHSTVPIMADESVIGLKDAFVLAGEMITHLLNIKLMKCGGITMAMKMLAIAEAGGISCMIGCMDESVISIASGLHCALCSGAVLYADLDGHLDISDDVATGGVVLKDGYLYPVDAEGFGLTVHV